MKETLSTYLLPKHLAGFILFLVTFLLYFNTLAPGVYGLDSAEFATGVATMGVVHPPGYPIYMLLGQLFGAIPIGDLAYRLNIMSAIFASLTILFTYKIIFNLFRDTSIAFASAATFAASYYFWSMAVIAEVYTLHTFFLALNIWWLLKWRDSSKNNYLYMFAFTYGLSLTNHTSGVLFAFGFLWLILSSPHRGWRNVSTVVAMGALFLVGLVPYVYLPLSVGWNPALNYPEMYYGVNLLTLDGVWWMISGQAYQMFAFGYGLEEVPREVARFVGFIWRNYLGVGVVVGVFGFTLFWKRDRNLLIGLMLIFCGNAMFFINYHVIDKETMFLPAYLVWAILISWGLLGVNERLRQFITRGYLPQRVLVFVPIIFILIPMIALRINWVWVDKSDEYGPQHFAEGIINTVDEGSLIIAPWYSAVVLEYHQIVLGERSDITIYNRSRVQVAEYYLSWKDDRPHTDIWLKILALERKMIDAEIKQRSIYVVGDDSRYSHAYDYIPQGDMYKLEPLGLLDFIHSDS